MAPPPSVGVGEISAESAPRALAQSDRASGGPVGGRWSGQVHNGYCCTTTPASYGSQEAAVTVGPPTLRPHAASANKVFVSAGAVETGDRGRSVKLLSWSPVEPEHVVGCTGERARERGFF